nr:MULTISPECIES: relaxase/mobilization nuclease domain-containing protein [Sphingobacterium]
MYNRVDNNGKTIGNYNHWHKSRKVCREMTEYYGYHLGKGKAKVNRQALRGNDKLRYAIHDALKSVMAKATTWKQVETMLARQGIDIHYKYRSGTSEVQGISFEKDNVKFKGSAIDRKFSFVSMEKQLSHNRGTEILLSATLADQIREMLQPQEQRSETYETGMGLLGDLLNMPASIEPEPDPMWRRKKKKPEEEKSREISR